MAAAPKSLRDKAVQIHALKKELEAAFIAEMEKLAVKAGLVKLVMADDGLHAYDSKQEIDVPEAIEALDDWFLEHVSPYGVEHTWEK